MTIELIKFGADWCAPCKKMEPVLKQFKTLGLCEVTSVDVDENPEKAAEYEVKGIPAFVWLKDGKVAAFHAGTCTIGVLKSTYEQVSTGTSTSTT